MVKAPSRMKGDIPLVLCHSIAKSQDKREILKSFEEISLKDMGIKGLILTLKSPWGKEETYSIPPDQTLPLPSRKEEEGGYRFDIELEGTLLGSLTIFPSETNKEALPEEKTWQTIAKILAVTLMKIWKEKELYQQLQAREEELEETVKELRKIKETQTAFMKRVAHELRTPLHSIIGFSQILKEEEDKLPPEAQNHLHLILEKAREMKEVIEDITLLWEMKMEEEELRLQEVALTQLVDQVLETLSPTILEKKLEVHKDLEVPKATLDGERIARALYHLLSNAVKFTPQGGEIGIKAEEMPGGIKISVWDTGIGIPPEHMEEIWEPFKQLEDPLTRKYQGMGVGLPLVKRIVTAHGGEVWAEKGEGGKGTRFVMIIPQAPK